MAPAPGDFAGVLRLPAGADVTLRPVSPDDGGALQAYVRALSQQSRYNRFFAALNELPPSELEHVTISTDTASWRSSPRLASSAHRW